MSKKSKIALRHAKRHARVTRKRTPPTMKTIVKDALGEALARTDEVLERARTDRVSRTKAYINATYGKDAPHKPCNRCKTITSPLHLKRGLCSECLHGKPATPSPDELMDYLEAGARSLGIDQRELMDMYFGADGAEIVTHDVSSSYPFKPTPKK